MITGVYRLLLLCALILFGYVPLFAQSSGLEFASHEVNADKRTGVSLSGEKALCFEDDMEMKFEFSFVPNQNDYFGYIFRITDENRNNIDFIYDKDSANHFKLICGNNYSKVSFNLPVANLYNSWTRIRIKVSPNKRLVHFWVGKKLYTQSINVSPGNCFKIFFGANDYGSVRTKDVPPMKIKNVEIAENGDAKYSWKFDEDAGNIAREALNEQNAIVNNPVWIRRLHAGWQFVQSIKTKGAASVAFDNQKEELFIIGQDSLTKYSFGSHQVSREKYESGQHVLLRGSQSLFNKADGKIYNYYTDQKKVITYNLQTHSWDSKFNADSITDNWHTNKFYSAADSSFYILGGYGHFRYKNLIRKYHIPTKSWTEVVPKGHRFIPRYLAALGQAGHGAYILGGFGSVTGQQLLSPQNQYDLIYFDAKASTLKKIYQLPFPEEDFVFANSMIVDEANGFYYALAFPQHKFNSSLQLIKGSLSKPEYKPLGNRIPLNFHDIRSFIDLYYSPVSKRFVAVTMFRNENDITETRVYSINSPVIARVQKAAPFELSKLAKVIVGFAALVLIVGTVIFMVRKRLKKNGVTITRQPNHDIPHITVKHTVPSALSEEERLPIIPTLEEPEIPNAPEEHYKSTIFTFGDLRLFSAEGDELTKYFTPLIKELFLLILLYTLRWERGISSEKLKELLWSSKSVQRARNNRSVNLGKLKSILDNLPGCEIVKQPGYWSVVIDYDRIKVDYYDYLRIVKDKSKVDKKKIIALSNITRRGAFLTNADYEWLDQFKAEISNDIIDTYLHFANSIEISDDPEFLIQVANYIFYFDAVNEEAMTIKCKAFSHLGKHSLAKTTYENFCKEYKVIYGEEFKRPFHAILE